LIEQTTGLRAKDAWVAANSTRAAPARRQAAIARAAVVPN